MSDGTKIEWTDATANVINGCTVVSPGCANCYAMKQAHRFPVRQGLTRQSPSGMTWTGEVRFSEAALEKVLGWRRPRMIFWNAHGDTFHPSVPDAWIDRCFDAMARTPHHTHQVLTKRPERMREYLSRFRPSPAWDGYITRDGKIASGGTGDEHAEPPYFNPARWPLPNVWLGTSVEDQQRADERVPILLDTPAAVRWISAEPLLGPVDLTMILVDHPAYEGLEAYLDSLIGETFDKGATSVERGDKIDWVVVGGESGPGSRPMHPDWARSLRDQCAAAGVAMLFKQHGDWVEYSGQDVCDRADSGRLLPKDRTVVDSGDSPVSRHASMWRIGKREAGRLLDGIKHDGYPATQQKELA